MPISRRDFSQLALGSAFAARSAAVAPVVALAATGAASAQDVEISAPPVSYELGVPAAASAKRMLTYQRAIQVYLHGLPSRNGGVGGDSSAHWGCNELGKKRIS